MDDDAIFAAALDNFERATGRATLPAYQPAPYRANVQPSHVSISRPPPSPGVAPLRPQGFANFRTKHNTQFGSGSARPKGAPAIALPQQPRVLPSTRALEDFPESVDQIPNAISAARYRPTKTNEKPQAFRSDYAAPAAFPVVADATSIRPPLYDPDNITTWVYPSNFEYREYQFQMVQSGLFHNTLVCLPTGLGKTFIAATIIFNFYRWFPEGKLIFVAPTKPLVHQQVQACHSVSSIPESDIIVMTGITMAPAKRAEIWDKKRLIFATPQVVENDIKTGKCPVDKVVLVVVDEAHRATGNTAMVNTIKALACTNPYFRVIGLTATPGSTQEAIQQVVSNLLTSRLEVRTDDDFDVKRYVHTKQIEKIEIPLSADMLAIKTHFFKTVKPLIDYIQNNGGMYRKKPEELTRGSVFNARKAYQTNPKHAPDDPTFQQLLSHFALSISMYHGLRLLSDHGVKQFHNWYLKMTAKPEQAVASRLHKLLIATPEWRNLGKETELAMHAASASHPKLIKVEEIILAHFQKHDDETTRAMIFTEFRDSVGQIVQFLEKHSPLIRPMAFIGQAQNGLSQKEQQKVVSDFRSGGYNVLVATSIGEEGLDIGEVDLIICFDASSSPIRMIQRMGRTGRKRDGRCVMLMTSDETGVQKRSETKSKSMVKSMLDSKNFIFYQNKASLLPAGIVPVPDKRLIHIEENFGGALGSQKPKKAAIGAKEVHAPQPSMIANHELLNHTINYQLPDFSAPTHRIAHSSFAGLCISRGILGTIDENYEINLLAHLNDEDLGERREVTVKRKVSAVPILAAAPPAKKPKHVIAPLYDGEDDEDDEEMLLQPHWGKDSSAQHLTARIREKLQKFAPPSEGVTRVIASVEPNPSPLAAQSDPAPPSPDVVWDSFEPPSLTKHQEVVNDTEDIMDFTPRRDADAKLQVVLEDVVDPPADLQVNTNSPQPIHISGEVGPKAVANIPIMQQPASSSPARTWQQFFGITTLHRSSRIAREGAPRSFFDDLPSVPLSLEEEILPAPGSRFPPQPQIHQTTLVPQQPPLTPNPQPALLDRAKIQDQANPIEEPASIRNYPLLPSPTKFDMSFVEPQAELRRLRRGPAPTAESSPDSSVNGSDASSEHIVRHPRQRNVSKEARRLLDDEVMVSGSASEDEDVGSFSDNSSFIVDGSMIEEDDEQVNMGNIYRRSLLSQAELRPANFRTPTKAHRNQYMMRFDESARQWHSTCLDGPKQLDFAQGDQSGRDQGPAEVADEVFEFSEVEPQRPGDCLDADEEADELDQILANMDVDGLIARNGHNM